MPQITGFETFLVDTPIERTFEQAERSVARVTEVVVRLHASDGTTGVGTGAALHTIRGPVEDSPLRGVAHMVNDHVAPAVVGHDPLRTEQLWDRMFSLTMDKKSPLSSRSGTVYPKGLERPQTMAAIAAVDIAVWDLAGRILGQPLWKLLGGHRDHIPAYTTGGYYGTGGDEGLAAEFQGYVDAGYRTVKLKAGGRNPQDDVARARVVREAVGPDIELLVDAHRGWTVEQAIRAGLDYERIGIGWFEEPAPWYDDIDGLARIRRSVRIPITSGESEHTAFGAIALIDRGLIDICNFDATKGGGLTEARRVATYAAFKGVEIAPHHAADIHAHLAAAVPNGRIVEAHGDPTRDPLAGNLLTGGPHFEDGHMVLSERPGLGVELNEEFLATVAERL
jgi:L-alanine-DL-glutamate epimerase-like enolase superfamily enzyme